MKNPIVELLPQVYDMLNGMLVVGSESIPVYDRVPNLPWDESKTYQAWVHIAEPTLTPFPAAKDRFLSTVVLQIEIACLYELQSESGGNIMADDIANQIMQLLIERGGSSLTFTNFHCIGQVLEDLSTEKGNIDTAYYTAKVLRIRYTFEQNQ
jgi:hypothetical protein